MRRLLLSFFSGALPVALTSCLNVVDVAQPLEVRCGSGFEVALVVRADADISNRARGFAFGVLAVSLPEGAAIAEASFRGAAKGRLRQWHNVDRGPLGERPGYAWVFFGTREPYEMSAVVGQTFDVKLKMKAGKTPGDYLLAYTAGVAPAAPEGGPDLGRVEWGLGYAGTPTARWVTFN